MKRVVVRPGSPGRRLAHAVLAWGALAGGLGLAGGCGHDTPVTPPPPPPRDTTPPVVRIVYPPPDSAGLYDRDSNGLADLEVSWSDSGGRVYPGSVRVTCVPDCFPGVAPDTNLALGWRVVRQDSTSVALEETLPLLMRAGARTLRVTVLDTAFNMSAPAQAELALPPGVYQRSISLAGGGNCQPERGVEFALSSDGTKGFAPYHFCIAVFDPEGVRPTHFVNNVPNLGWASFISLDTATGLAYLGGGGTPTSGFTIFDTRTEQLVGISAPVGAGLASVAVDGDRIYAGEACTDGRIFVYDKHSLAELGRIEVGATSFNGSCPNVQYFAFTRDHAEGWASLVGAGVARLDLTAMRMVAHYDLESSFPDYYGDSREIELVADQWLYVARIGEGFDLYQASPWSRLDRLSSPCCFVTIALSPDRATLAVNVWSFGPYGGVPGDTPRLYDIGPTLALRYTFPPRLGRITDAIRFHPDGKRLYVMAEFQVDVYLVRPK